MDISQFSYRNRIKGISFKIYMVENGMRNPSIEIDRKANH